MTSGWGRLAVVEFERWPRDGSGDDKDESLGLQLVADESACGEPLQSGGDLHGPRRALCRCGVPFDQSIVVTARVEDLSAVEGELR